METDDKPGKAAPIYVQTELGKGPGSGQGPSFQPSPACSVEELPFCTVFQSFGCICRVGFGWGGLFFSFHELSAVNLPMFIIKLFIFLLVLRAPYRQNIDSHILATKMIPCCSL